MKGFFKKMFLNNFIFYYFCFIKYSYRKGLLRKFIIGKDWDFFDLFHFNAAAKW